MAAGRLQRWIDHEVAEYERHYGPLGDKEDSYREHLAGTLNAAQLRVADASGELGDSVLRALREHSGRLRDSQLARWFRSRL